MVRLNLTRAALRIFIAVALLAISGCTSSVEEDRDGGALSPASLAEKVDEARTRLQASPGGRQILDAIDAHGGLEAWYRAPTSSYTWEYANAAADLQFKSFLIAENSTRRVYHDLLSVGPYGNPRPVDARFAWDGSDAWMYPDSIDAINPRFWATTGYYFEQIPFVLADPGLNYELLPADTLNGRRHDLVRISFDPGVGDSPGDTYVVYIDNETKRVGAVRYTVTYGRPASADEPERQTLFEYGDYVTVNGLTVPRRFRGFTYSDGSRGAFRNEAWADSISFRRPFDASKLIAPEGARIAPDPRADG